MKKLQKLFAMLLAVCMVMSLLSIGASANEGGESVPESNFKCGMELHVHNADCYTTTAENCTIQQDLVCTEHTEHDEGCYETHVHTEECYTVVPASENWTCPETATEHVHVEGTCYTVIPESKTLTCQLPTDPQLVCQIELHTHTAACYVPHTHVDSCYIAKQICQLPVHEAHVEDCLSDAAKAVVDSMAAQLTAIDSLQEMQDKRGTYTVSSNYNAANEAIVAEHNAARSGYEAYLADMWEKRAAAKAAYAAMDPELKAMVSPELVEKLSDELDTWWVVDHNPTMTRTITQGTAPYYFQVVNTYRCYEYSHHKTADDNYMVLMIMVDSSEGEGSWTWMADGRYVPGKSNYDLVYCSDVATSVKDGTKYRRINLEEAGYYGPEAAEHIRSIVLSSYPFVSVEEMRENLIAGGMDSALVNKMGRSEMIAGVQMAIWSFANDGEDAVAGNTVYGKTYRVPNGSSFHDYTNEYWKWWDSKNGKYSYDAEAETCVNALVDYLTALSGVKPAQNEIVITGLEVVGDPVPVLGFGGMYEVVLKVKLNSSGSSDKDNMTLTATVGTGVDATVVTADVVPGQNEYYMLVPAVSGDEITVEVSGTQHLPQGAYFYQPEGGRGTSQNLVGVAMGDTAVYAKASKTFMMDPEDDVYATAELQVQKVDGSYTPLTGAEFTLAADMDHDGDMDPFKTYTVNEQGYVVNDYGYEGIVDLIPGITYELTETKAPAGYMAISGSIRFDVVMEGENAVVQMGNLPFGVSYADDGSGVEVLRVINMPAPTGGGGGPIITPNVPEEEIEEGDVPLGNLPEEELEIPEEDVPLAELPEEEVPLAMAPATGDASVIWAALSALSGAGLFLTRKKREDEE